MKLKRAEDYKMNCRKAKKYIYLFRDGELSQKEKKQLEQHLKNCQSCSHLFNDLNEFKRIIVENEDADELIENPEKLTNSILNAIDEADSKKSLKIISITSHPVFRVAASFLIILQITLFFSQQTYIDNSVADLYIRLNSDKSIKNTNVINSNSECIEQSRTIVASLYGDVDNGLKKKAIAFTKKLSKNEIEGYAVQLCQYSYEVQKTKDRNKKKELLIHIINKELNIKL